jgi:tetratricopeptide (TPR) repeat protein
MMRSVLTKLVFALVAVAFLGTSFESRADDKFAKMLIKKADKKYAKRAKKGAAGEAREAYEKVLAVDPQNIEARWKLARALYWIGTHTDAKDKKMEIYEAGIRYCQEAVKLDDNCVPCHFWLGVAYGKFGEAKGILQSLGLVPHLKAAMEKVVKLDEKYAHGGAHRVLGRLYNKLPGIKGGDNDKALKHLAKAIEIGPHDLMNRRFLAEVQLAMGNKDEAKATLQTIIDYPDDQLYKDRKPESKEEKKTAEKLMKKHFGG